MSADYFNDAYNKYLMCKNYASNEKFNDADYFTNQKSELFYFYKPEIKDSIQRVKREIFFGCWKNNLIGDHGVYYWIDEPLNSAGNNFNKIY